MNSLAIVIPYYKLKFFRHTLESLASQSNKSFTVYIGNDGSPENPDCIISEYQSRISINYTDFKNNVGSTSLVNHWRRCISMVNDEKYLMILGDDDILDPDCIQEFYKVVDLIEKQNIKVLRYATRVIDVLGKPIGKEHYCVQYESSLEFFIKKLSGKARSSLSEYIFLLEQAKLSRLELPLAWYADDLLYLKASDFGTIYTINESKVNVRASSLNISGNKLLNRKKNIASNVFFHHLLTRFEDWFIERDKNLLLTKLEKSVINDKTNLKLFFNLIHVYFKNGEFRRVMPFLKNAFKSIRF
ncbi:glycosyltransferase [Leeuwenhoekiella sp. ZYFB001]|uniref:glycosyltransferase n=1 Tax=Leeuwenhoekiella sp. ZYFB001 TaxID=2719912 RepID=UPI00143158AC|nr:glycosyltransferase [Leeuwenhoekiella sp. ZYFB001]